VVTIHNFVKKETPNNMVNGNFSKVSKQLPHFEEESCEITKNLGRFRQIYNFFLLKLPYLANRL
jgi:hypothetical protein